MTHQLAILYRHGDATSDELRWCLRSLANVSGCNPVPLVVGDPPSWYTGPRLWLTPGSGHAGRDVRAKLEAIAASDLVAERFACLADDNVIVRPIEFENLMVPRTHRAVKRDPAEGWQSTRYNTAQHLTELGLPVRDAETHWPRCWEKARLAEMLARYPGGNWSWKTLYLGLFGGPAQRNRGEAQHMGKGRIAICDDALVISHKDKSFRAGLRSELQRRFPAACPWETGRVPEVEIVGHVSRTRQHACQHLGPRIGRRGPRLELHHECSKVEQCRPFAAVGSPGPMPCRGCASYDPDSARLLSIGGPAATSGGAGCRTCGQREGRDSATMEPAAIARVLELVPTGGTILEFGAGRSTAHYTAAGRHVVAVEHDPAWRKSDGVEWIPAQLAGDWYQVATVRACLTGRKFDAVIVDGPPARLADRSRVREVLDLVDPRCPVIIDDADRPREAQLVRELQQWTPARTVERIGRAAILLPAQ